jgi:hypothetical protein
VQAPKLTTLKLTPLQTKLRKISKWVPTSSSCESSSAPEYSF